MKNVLNVKNIYASIGGKQILKDVSFDISENEIMGERKSMYVTVYGILIAIRRSYELPAARS